VPPERGPGLGQQRAMGTAGKQRRDPRTGNRLDSWTLHGTLPASEEGPGRTAAACDTATLSRRANETGAPVRKAWPIIVQKCTHHPAGAGRFAETRAVDWKVGESANAGNGTPAPSHPGQPFCASFAQVSLNVMVRLKTSFCGVLSGSNAK
jgi:hypothetical protein